MRVSGRARKHTKRVRAENKIEEQKRRARAYRALVLRLSSLSERKDATCELINKRALTFVMSAIRAKTVDCSQTTKKKSARVRAEQKADGCERARVRSHCRRYRHAATRARATRARA